MINFKITSLVDGNLTIEKAQGKSVLLTSGETIKAEVMNILPSGNAVLRIKGELITAKTEVPLQQGEAAFFKVSDSTSSAGELKLQFMGYENSSGDASVLTNFMNSPEGKTLAGLIQELSDSLLKQGSNQSLVSTLEEDGGVPVESGRADSFPLDKIESLLKALPADINALPGEIKTGLQQLLQSSLRSTGQSIQLRLETVLSQLSDIFENSGAAGNFKSDIMLNMERLLSGPLKNALLNSGVVLEAKLKSTAFSLLLDAADVDNETAGSAGSTDLPQGAAPSGKEWTTAQTNTEAPKDAAPAQTQPSPLPALGSDLKAVLLELKQRFSAPLENSSAAQDSKTPAAAKETVQDVAALRNMQGKIEGLLKDIETFQALSKTTDSFYTFLPVSWKELKDGDLAFKRGREGATGGTTSSCRINLSLDGFGSLSVLVLMNNRDFFVSFKADRPASHSLINSNLAELKSSFAEKGLNLKAAHMLDKTDATMDKLDKLGSSESIISIKT
ncbi:MAG TPA: flagellar hook-length control protein FliK [Dissulfurispiraceae bacterium]|nr:flagellar hook-length control protein FliK [Dissulfurispiraceae bacterium]